MGMIKLPESVTKIYEAVQFLEQKYKITGRKFTPDGHLVGSIGEVIAAEYFGLELLPMSYAGHDARDKDGRLVQIKLTAGKRISMYALCDRLIVMKIIDPQWAQIIFDGSGCIVWDACGPIQKNGQRSISLNKLKSIC